MAEKSTPILFNPTKGLHTDYSPLAQPEGTYTYLLNGIRSLSGDLENEQGTIDIKILNKKVIGGCVLDQDLILFLYPSEIGVLNKDDLYTKITDKSTLNFVDNQIFGVVAKKNFKSERIVYFVDGANPNRRVNLDDLLELNSLTFDNDIKLQLTAKTPITSLVSVEDGGSLVTGVYQATSRLLTRSTNAASWGELTPLVSIIDDSSTLSFDSIDGAAPQTSSNKLIRFVINDIDISYSFIEIAILTYIGTANILKSNIVARIPIEGRDTISFTYSSTDQNIEAIDLSSIAIKPVVYDTAKCIVQKDNILVLSNLTSSQDQFNFQPAFNLTKLRYFIEEIPFQPGYKDAIIAALKVGYMRGEVYSFAGVSNRVGSYNTTAYHIPGREDVSAGYNPIPANTTTKELGTYYSLEEYPNGKGYPPFNNLFGKRVRHHRMPTAQQEPTIVIRNGTTYLRVLGIEADFTDTLAAISADVLDKVSGFSIVRQLRGEQNKSILSQGIANIHNNLSAGSGTGRRNAFVLPGSGAGNYAANEGWTNGIGSAPGSNLLGDQIAFYSPETIIYQSSLSSATAIVPVSRLIGTQTLVAEQRTLPKRKAYLFLDYTTQVPNNLSPINISNNSAQYISAGAQDAKPDDCRIPIQNGTGLVSNYVSNGYLYLKLASNLPINETIYGDKPEFFYLIDNNGTDHIYLNGIDSNTSKTSSSSRFLFNVTKSLTNQYGSVSTATYIHCKTWDKTSSSIFKFFGGDTYITKFSVVSMAGTDLYNDLDTNIQLNTLNYFFVESSINTNFRHYNAVVGTEGQPGFIAGTVPYYPKYQPIYESDVNKKPGILNISWALGHPRGYNKQYSFENSLIKYFPKGLAEETVSKFENRSSYSEQSGEGEQLDAYRVFLPNNYYDLPKDKGPITNSVVHKNTIFLQTTGATWRTFFNEKVTQASSIGQVYLGTGGVFDRPAEPLQTVAGGYGGTQGKWGVSTPYGFFYIDARQKILFNLDNQLDDLTGQGLDNFFSEIEETDQFHLAFDYENYRLLVTSSKGWTLSYQVLLKSWTGFHSYLPQFMISRGKEFYMSDPTKLVKLNVGAYGSYFGVYQPFKLEYVVNVAPLVTKSFDNLIVYADTKTVKDTSVIGPSEASPDFVIDRFTTFNKVRVYNDLKDTSEIQLICPKNFQEEWISLSPNQTHIKFKNQEYRLAIPKDRLVSPNIPNEYSELKDFRPQMTGKWAKISLEFNHQNKSFVLHTIETKVKQVAR